MYPIILVETFTEFLATNFPLAVALEPTALVADLFTVTAMGLSFNSADFFRLKNNLQGIRFLKIMLNKYIFS